MGDEDVGSINWTVDLLPCGEFGGRKIFKYTLTAVSDSGGVFPNTVIPGITGELVKIVTQPINPFQDAQFTATDWDLIMYDPDATALDILDSKGLHRDPYLATQIYPVVSGAVTPILVSGDYNVEIDADQAGPPEYYPVMFNVYLYVLSLE